MFFNGPLSSRGVFLSEILLTVKSTTLTSVACATALQVWYLCFHGLHSQRRDLLLGAQCIEHNMNIELHEGFALCFLRVSPSGHHHVVLRFHHLNAKTKIHDMPIQGCP
jgi:hypothetical protein